MTPAHHTQRRSADRPGFSLVELLTVIAIIALLIAILLPALGAVRTSGWQASTQSLLVNLNAAAASFELDNRRQPGYFSAAEVGSTTNFNNGAGPGLTALENAMLDLSGAGAISVDRPADTNGWLEVNPTADTDRAIWVKTDLIGADENSYFVPSDASLVYMSTTQQPGSITQQATPNPGMPDLVDAFGQPILAWIENPSGPRNISETHQFAALNAEDVNSRFYWAANGSMLSSSSLGERGKNMTTSPVAGSIGSLIGRGAYSIGEDAVEGVMAALLGHPGYPDEALLSTGDYDAIFPTRPRGSFIAHSAGKDGVYLGAADNKAGRILGADMLGGANFDITYGVNFFSDTGGTRRTGDNNQPETADFLDAFDDLVVAQ
jgi:prepilin-type N-terminal cleavage/methylation domain-containing protein